jgi:hypothetical protein
LRAALLGEVVTWIRVERPVFDLVGVLVSSLTFTLIVVGFGFMLGAGFGGLLILRSRRGTAQVSPLPLGIGSHQP